MLGWSILTGCSIAITYLGWQLHAERRRNDRLESGYWSERRGRTRVEQEMRRLTEVQLNTSEGFFVQPIGVIDSCYRQCVGTPRQGALCPTSRASVTLTPNMSPESLDGLDEFSHVWLTFKFHLNTNTLKEAKAFQGVTAELTGGPRSRSQGNQRFTFTGKVTPPMLKEKKGVLATRTPHRPNPFGVTLARVERVDKRLRRLHLSACDLVQGTPILDIKPYVAAYDTVPAQMYRVPDWIARTIETRNVVTAVPSVQEAVQRIAGSLKQYKHDPDAFMRGLVETLEADVRSKFQTQRRISDADAAIPVEVPFDDATVFFFWRDERELEIVDVLLTRHLSPAALSSTEARAKETTGDALVRREAEEKEEKEEKEEEERPRGARQRQQGRKKEVRAASPSPSAPAGALPSPSPESPPPHSRPQSPPLSPASPITIMGGELFIELEGEAEGEGEGDEQV